MSTLNDNDGDASNEFANIAGNYQLVRERVHQAAVAAGLPSVRLVAVSKTKPVAALQAAYEAGCRTFGENYVQEIAEKAPVLAADIQWHYIGALQSNKVKQLVSAVQPAYSRLTVETVSSVKLANKLNSAVVQVTTTDGTEAAAADRLKVMVQVNTSAEDTKSGVEPADCLALCQHIVQNCPNLQLTGLMTIGAPGDSTCFEILKNCRDAVQAADIFAGTTTTTTSAANHPLELSMGMSDDFEQAIAAGATNVRVGSTIFGARQYANK